MTAPLSAAARRWLTHLRTAGAFVPAAAAHAVNAPPAALEPIWAELLRAGYARQSGGLLWDARSAGLTGHARHAAMVGGIYLQLMPWLAAFTRARPAQGPAPDARLRLVGGRQEIWLEADTGKESGAQWRRKALRYRLAEPHPLWVVAQGGPRRLQRLRAILAAVPPAGPWLLTDPSGVGPTAVAWAAGLPSPAPPVPAAAPAAALRRYYQRGQPLDPARAHALLEAGQLGWGGVDIRHRETRYYLVPTVKAPLAPPPTLPAPPAAPDTPQSAIPRED